MNDHPQDKRSEHYDRSFYAARQTDTAHAAHATLSILFDVLPIRSVADFGCGTGTWLATAMRLGAERVMGLEGTWLDLKVASIAPDCISLRDLESPILLSERFDLAISLEVAEHLSPQRAKSFVDDLCAVSDIVLFGAAIPGQGGEYHVNERWQSYWAGLFEANGYRTIDAVRATLWSDPNIPYWYKQNTLLYVEASAVQRVKVKLSLTDSNTAVLDLVHPDLYRLHRYPGILRSLKRAFVVFFSKFHLPRGERRQ